MPRRQRLHALLADTMERVYGERAEALPTFEAEERVDVVTRICRDMGHQLVWANRAARCGYPDHDSSCRSTFLSTAR